MPSFYGRRNKKNSELNPEKSIDGQFNILRVVDNQRYPAFFKVHGVTFRLTIEKESTWIVSVMFIIIGLQHEIF